MNANTSFDRMCKQAELRDARAALAGYEAALVEGLDLNGSAVTETDAAWLRKAVEGQRQRVEVAKQRLQEWWT